MKKNGVIILSGPLYWPVYSKPHDFFRFTKYGFQNFVGECGFFVAGLRENGGAWATVRQSLVHSFGFSTNKFFFFRIIRFFFVRMGIKWLYNTIFLWLDKTDHNPVNTINYVIVAPKTY